MSVSAMKKLTVLAYGKDADSIVRKLMNLKCVDIRSTNAGEGLVPFDTMACDSQRGEAEKRLSDIRRALPILNRYTTRKGGFGRIVHRVDREAFCRDGRDTLAWKTVCDTLAIAANVEEWNEELTRAKALLAALSPWLSYDAPLNAGETAKTKLLLGSYPAGTLMEDVRDELADVDAYPEEISEDESGLYVAITMLKEGSEAVEKRLTERGFLKTTAFSEITGTARAVGEATDARIEEIGLQLLRAEEQMRDAAENLADVEILD